MVLSVGHGLRYIPYIQFLKYTALAGLDGIDRLAYIVGDIVHRISLVDSESTSRSLSVSVISLHFSHLWSYREYW